MSYSFSGDKVKEYSPSQCSTRFQNCEKPNEAVLSNFVDATTQETNRVRQVYKCRRDIRYGGENDNQVLDIYFKSAETKNSPIFVFIHGGYWQYLTKDSAGSFVAPLVERGYRVIAADYNLCPTVTLKQLTHQIVDFFKWLLDYAKDTDAKKISICGHSAGAHLLSYIISKELIEFPYFNHLSDLFFISGLYDLRELYALPEVNENNNLAITASADAEDLSPLLLEVDAGVLQKLQKNGTNFYVLVAENDSETFKAQTKAFAKKLKDLHLNVEHKVFKNYDHFDIIEEACDEKSSIGSYILSKLKISN